MSALPVAVCPYCPVRLGKVAWIRLNRGLAWSLALSPMAQVILGTDFWRGLWLDAGLLVAHGALSLVLFGLPRASPRWLLWVGIEPQGLSARGKFLLTGWRISLAVVYTPLLWFVPVLSILFGLPFLLLWVFLPLRILKHLFLATGYALRRWRMGPVAASPEVALLLVIVFALASTVNVLR